MCYPAISDGRTWSKLGEQGEHGKDGKHRSDDLKNSIYDSKHSICDSNHSICRPDDLKHSLFRHLWRRLKIPQHKHDPGSALDERTWSEYIHVWYIRASQKNWPVCALVSGKQSVWGLVLGAAEQTVLQIFWFTRCLQSVLGRIFALFVVSVFFCSTPTWPNMYTQTWNLSKDLQDRRFQGKKFTQKTRNFRHLLNPDKKCVNALNWDYTSKKCSVTM